MTQEQIQRIHRAFFDLWVEANEAALTFKAYAARARTAWHDGISEAIRRREARAAAFNR